MPRALPNIPVLAAASIGLYWLPGLAWICPPLCSPLGIRRVLPHADGVLLTFDDGPHPQGTPAVLDLLAQTGAKAVFFLVGEQVRQRPTLAAEIAAAGHEIALHCYRHRLLLTLTPGQVAEDLRLAVEVIGDATGRAPRFYRPPYGVFSVAGLALAKRNEWTNLHWSRDGRDWQRHATATTVANRATRGLRGGDILLFHDADYYSAPGSWRQTVGALPRVFEAIAARQLTPVEPRGCCPSIP